MQGKHASTWGIAPAQLALIGGVAGLVNALTGGGGGLVVLLCLQRTRGLDHRYAYAAAVTSALCFTLLSAGAYAALGRMNLLLLLLVAPAMAVGGFFGVRLLDRISKRLLSGLLGACLLISGLCMMLF